MFKHSFKKLLCVLPVALILATFGLINNTAYAATPVTGTDANGFKWNFDGISVTITGYSGSGGAITIPSSEIVDGVSEPVLKIGEYAFFNCWSITTVTIPSSFTSIGNYAFYYCSVKTVNIPSGVTSIGSYAFYRCSGLSTINMPNGLTKIDSDAFGYCSSLASINLPNTLKTIGFAAFECSALQSITIPSSVTSMGTEVFYCSGLKSATIENGVTNIGDYTFYGCSLLTSVNLPSSLTAIYPYTFHGTKLSSITIPSNVKSIGNEAFSGCSSLTSVSIFSNNTTFGSGVFSGTPSSLSLYGFSGSTTNTFATANSKNFIPFSVSGISMKSYPTKNQYFVGDTLDLTGAAITVLYNSGSTQDVAVASGMCDVTTLTASGQQHVAVTLSGQTTTFDVTVTNPVRGITQLPGTLTVDAGGTQPLSAPVIPSNADNPAITWSSSDGSVATVDNKGCATGISAGSAVITATSVDGGFSTSCNVTVQYINATGALLTPMSATLGVDKTLSLKATVYPNNASDKNVTWSSSDQSVASVDNNGVVTANAPGSATITATTEDGGKTATSAITVIIPVSSIDVSGSNSLTVGGTAVLTASLQPLEATNQQFAWSSKNPSIVSVDQNGNIRGISAGTTEISVRAKDNGGVSKTYTVAVSAPTVPTPTPSPTLIDLSNPDLLAAALDAVETSRNSVTIAQTHFSELHSTLSSQQQAVANDQAKLDTTNARIEELKSQAEALAAIIMVTSTIPGAGDEELGEAFELIGIYSEIDDETALMVGLEETIPEDIDLAAATEAEIEAEEVALAQGECDEAAAEAVVKAETDGMGQLAGKTFDITEDGLSTVENHLATFGDNPDNTAMLNKLQQALENGEKLSGAEASFYLHELKEAEYVANGMLSQEAHLAAIDYYGVSPYSIYARDVVQSFPWLFNDNWFIFWGLK